MVSLRNVAAALSTSFLWVSAAEGSDPDFQGIPLRTHSLRQPYVDTELHSRWWDFGGDALIRTDSYVRLAADRPSQAGWIFSRVPLTATNWEIEVTFSINGNGHLYGDGLAMWLTKQRGTQGKVFGSSDKFEGLGIFFDTYKNNRPGVTFPYVMAMLGDGNTEYDKDNDGKSNELAGCSARGIRNVAFPTKARLTYVQDENLVLQLQYKNEEDWTPCFDIPNVKLPSVSYLGFSAETGELHDNHDIISVEAKNLYDAKARNTQRKESINARRDKAKKVQGKNKGSWLGFLLKAFLFFLVCGAAYVGYTAYRTNKRNSRSRF